MCCMEGWQRTPLSWPSMGLSPMSRLVSAGVSQFPGCRSMDNKLLALSVPQLLPRKKNYSPVPTRLEVFRWNAVCFTVQRPVWNPAAAIILVIISVGGHGWCVLLALFMAVSFRPSPGLIATQSSLFELSEVIQQVTEEWSFCCQGSSQMPPMCTLVGEQLHCPGPLSCPENRLQGANLDCLDCQLQGQRACFECYLHHKS